MKPNQKFLIIAAFCVVVIVLAVGVGSVYIPPSDTVRILLKKMFGVAFASEPDAIAESILWKLRLPRAVLAFIAGGALAVSGVVVQSVLRNPLASSYTLGVSSGAALGATIAITFRLTMFGALTLPLFGLGFALLTIFSALALASRLDKSLDNITIVLTGMAFSLFANAIITFLMSIAREELQKLIFWQLGSFAMKSWTQPALLAPVTVIATGIIVRYSAEMDIMTFGEEHAKISGVDAVTVKIILIGVSAVLTGCTVSLVGIIGFVDLFTPHVARRVFGARHKYVTLASLLLGGSFMVLCDFLARTVAAPLELPVGAVSSAIGAPFFLYIYFRNRKKG